MRVTRRYRFCASHRLHAPQLSEAENQRLYGKCNNPYGHGHDYVLDVSVRGTLDDAGRVLDVRALDEFVRREILTAFDHKNLNVDGAAFAATVPTTENLVVEVERRLLAGWAGIFQGGNPMLEKVRILETKNNAVERRVTRQ